MLSAAPPFPTVEPPAGWTREVRGPRLWLVPPAPGGRIVLPPLQLRPKNHPPQMFLDRILLQEADRFTKLKQSEPVTMTTKHHDCGLVVDVAALDDQDNVIEWRCYAVFATDVAFAVMFLQAKPACRAELRPLFLACASTLVMPESPPRADEDLSTEQL